MLTTLRCAAQEGAAGERGAGRRRGQAGRHPARPAGGQGARAARSMPTLAQGARGGRGSSRQASCVSPRRTPASSICAKTQLAWHQGPRGQQLGPGKGTASVTAAASHPDQPQAIHAPVPLSAGRLMQGAKGAAAGARQGHGASDSRSQLPSSDAGDADDDTAGDSGDLDASVPDITAGMRPGVWGLGSKISQDPSSAEWGPATCTHPSQIIGRSSGLRVQDRGSCKLDALGSSAGLPLRAELETLAQRQVACERWAQAVQTWVPLVLVAACLLARPCTSVLQAQGCATPELAADAQALRTPALTTRQPTGTPARPFDVGKIKGKLASRGDKGGRAKPPPGASKKDKKPDKPKKVRPVGCPKGRQAQQAGSVDTWSGQGQGPAWQQGGRAKPPPTPGRVQEGQEAGQAQEGALCCQLWGARDPVQSRAMFCWSLAAESPAQHKCATRLNTSKFCAHRPTHCHAQHAFAAPVKACPSASGWRANGIRVVLVLRTTRTLSRFSATRPACPKPLTSPDHASCAQPTSCHASTRRPRL